MRRFILAMLILIPTGFLSTGCANTKEVWTSPTSVAIVKVSATFAARHGVQRLHLSHGDAAKIDAYLSVVEHLLDESHTQTDVLTVLSMLDKRIIEQGYGDVASDVIDVIRGVVLPLLNEGDNNVALAKAVILAGIQGAKDGLQHVPARLAATK